RLNLRARSASIQEPIHRGLVAEDVHCTSDEASARVARATIGAPRSSPNPAGRTPEVRYALDRHAGKIPLPGHRFRKSLPDTAPDGPALFARKGPHCVAQREGQLRM